MRAIYVPLSDTALSRLIAVAHGERRHPKDQATILLEQALAAAQPPDDAVDEQAAHALTHDVGHRMTVRAARRRRTDGQE
jgi:hypothetical protein